MFGRFRRRAERRVRELLLGEPVLLVSPGAGYFGAESRRGMEVRGNGCLAASEHAVAFAMWVTKRRFVIPRADIVAVDTTRVHVRKSAGRRSLLRIAYRRPEGDIDRVAFLVDDLQAWLGLLGGSVDEGLG